MGVSENSRHLILVSFLEGSYNLGYYIRVPYFRKLPYRGLSTLSVGQSHSEVPTVKHIHLGSGLPPGPEPESVI